MSIQEINTEEFLEVIKEHAAVWDHNCEDYRIAVKKSKAWDSVARSFIENYEELSKHDRFTITRKLQNKWRNLRDSYVRAMKKKATEGGRDYIYQKHLTFLESTYAEKRKPRESSDSEESSDDGGRRKKIKKERDSPPAVLRRNTASDTYLEYVQSNSDVDALVHMNQSQSEFDDDKLFFESLLPATRQFDIDQKLHFRSEVLSLISKIRKSGRSSSL